MARNRKVQTASDLSNIADENTNGNKKRARMSVKKYWQLYLMLIPVVVFFFLFNYLPTFGTVMAFQDYRMTRGFLHSEWVGLKNFIDIFTDSDFYQKMWNTIIISVSKIIFSLPLPIILALLINEMRRKRLQKTVQTMIYLPHFVSWVILAGIMKSLLSPQDGLINELLLHFGIIDEPILFLGRKDLFRPIVVLSDIWKNAGWGTIVYFAAITGIDPALYEAAELDGAGRFKQMWYITLPCIRNTIAIVLILSAGSILSAGFEHVLNLYNVSVYETGDIIDTYVYRMGLTSNKFSYAAAVGLFKSIVSTILVVFANKTANRLEAESLY